MTEAYNIVESEGIVTQLAPPAHGGTGGLGPSDIELALGCVCSGLRVGCVCNGFRVEEPDAPEPDAPEPDAPGSGSGHGLFPHPIGRLGVFLRCSACTDEAKSRCLLLICDCKLL